MRIVCEQAAREGSRACSQATVRKIMKINSATLVTLTLYTFSTLLDLSRPEKNAMENSINVSVRSTPGGALGYFLGGYVPPGTPNWHPVLKNNFP